jgi:hypothetical protein
MASPQPLTPTSILKAQWSNPRDVFSLLLLIRSDVIQQAIARLVGYRPRLACGYGLAPVAFSFGWVAYGFGSLGTAFGQGRLMPEPDIPIQVINCENGYARENRSWLLGRLVGDSEHRVRTKSLSHDPPPDSTGDISLLIDIFVTKQSTGGGIQDTRTWWFCWAPILLQQAVGIFPWVAHGDWTIFLITAFGTGLALLTAGMPQWCAEKWPSSQLVRGKMKATALTRGNGHQYVMILLSHEGALDVEAMSSSRLPLRPETPWILGALAIMWVVLLITAAGLLHHTWYLIAVGTIGMLQNTMASAMASGPEAIDLAMEPWAERPTIAGYRYSPERKKVLKQGFYREYSDWDARCEYGTGVTESHVRDVMGALMELEKHQKRAGAALLPVFFPGSMDLQPTSLAFERERKFWTHAFLQHDS